jgi:hypothetical protein
VRTHHNRLQHADLSNAVHELGHLVFVEDLAWLLCVRSHRVHRYLGIVGTGDRLERRPCGHRRGRDEKARVGHIGYVTDSAPGSLVLRRPRRNQCSQPPAETSTSLHTASSRKASATVALAVESR